MACITSSIDLSYLIKTSWCRWITFIKENLILLICPFCFNIRLGKPSLFSNTLLVFHSQWWMNVTLPQLMKGIVFLPLLHLNLPPFQKMWHLPQPHPYPPLSTNISHTTHITQLPSMSPCPNFTHIIVGSRGPTALSKNLLTY